MIHILRLLSPIAGANLFLRHAIQYSRRFFLHRIFWHSLNQTRSAHCWFTPVWQVVIKYLDVINLVVVRSCERTRIGVKFWGFYCGYLASLVSVDISLVNSSQRNRFESPLENVELSNNGVAVLLAWQIPTRQSLAHFFLSFCRCTKRCSTLR